MALGIVWKFQAKLKASTIKGLFIIEPSGENAKDTMPE